MIALKRLLPTIVSALVAVVLTSAPAPAIPDALKVQTYRGNLAFPIDMDWLEGTKKIFFTQKGGKVRVMVGRKLLKRACVALDVDSSAEQGALGIALHPKFKQNHYLYVFYTNNSPHDNRVTRFTVRKNRCRNPKNILTGLTAGGYHNAGQLEFVKGKLFVSTGEAHSPGLAQNKSNIHGKILRLNPNGTAADGNPFDNKVWSYGHRNPFGLTHNRATGKIYVTENGPSCDDELNLIKKGRNYGWGSGYNCGTRGVGTNPVGPIRRWSSIIVPTDPTWYRGTLKRLNGDLYVGDFGAGRLHRIHLNGKGNKVKFDRTIYNADGGIVDVAKGPGGYMYFLTPGGIFRIVRR
jgi:aldose sugar dehydrogenase